MWNLGVSTTQQCLCYSQSPQWRQCGLGPPGPQSVEQKRVWQPRTGKPTALGLTYRCSVFIVAQRLHTKSHRRSKPHQDLEHHAKMHQTRHNLMRKVRVMPPQESSHSYTFSAIRGATTHPADITPVVSCFGASVMRSLMHWRPRHPSRGGRGRGRCSVS